MTPRQARDPRLAAGPFAVDPRRDVTIRVTADAAALNATDLVLRTIAAGPIVAGHRFSIGGSLYEITAAVRRDDGRIDAGIRPWLRAPIDVDTACEFAVPVCAMRLADDASGALQFSAPAAVAPDVSFVEAFT